MKRSQFQNRMSKFATLTLLGVLFGSTVSSQDAWVLEEQWSEKVVDSPAQYIEYSISNDATSATLVASFSVPGEWGYHGKATCQASWTPPPKIMKPNETVFFSYRASAKGFDSRGGYHFDHGCHVAVSVEYFSVSGKSLFGGSAGLKGCNASIGGGKTTTSQCEVTDSWVAPGADGSPGRVAQITIYAEGHQGWGGQVYKYVLHKQENQPQDGDHDVPEPEDDDEVVVETDQPSRDDPPSFSCASDVCPGAPSATPTFSRWESIRPNRAEATFAGQPGRTWPITVCGGQNLLNGNQYLPGKYMVSVAFSDPKGMTISRWRTTGAYSFDGGTRYLAVLNKHDNDTPVVELKPNHSDLNQYSEQNPERSMIYVRNENPDNWMSICVYPVGGSVADCCFGGTDNVVRHVPDEKAVTDSGTSGNWADLLFSGKDFEGLCTNHNGIRWPNIIRFTRLDKASGTFSGEIEWTTLNSVHRIEGVISGDNITFSETEHIRKGSAYLNSVYELRFDKSTNSLIGSWHDPVHLGYHGDFSLGL